MIHTLEYTPEYTTHDYTEISTTLHSLHNNMFVASLPKPVLTTAAFSLHIILGKIPSSLLSFLQVVCDKLM